MSPRVSQLLALHDDLLAGPTGRKANRLGALLNPEPIQDLADYLEPLTPANAGVRIGDQIIYWLAYLRFGRLGGRGISRCGRGHCDSTTKAIWATFGLAPTIMFVTGAIIGWTRVIAPRRRSTARSPWKRAV